MVAGAGYLANCFCIAMFVLFVATLATVIVWLDRRKRKAGYVEPYRVTSMSLEVPAETATDPAPENSPSTEPPADGER
jgi:hypothetical protein